MAHKQVSHRNTKVPKKGQIIVCTHESKTFPRGVLHYTTLIMVNDVGPHNLGEGGNSSCTIFSCVLVYIVGHRIELSEVCNNIHLPTLFTKSVIGNQTFAIESCGQGILHFCHESWRPFKSHPLELRRKYNIPHNPNIICSMRGGGFWFSSKRGRKIFSPQKVPQWCGSCHRTELIISCGLSPLD